MFPPRIDLSQQKRKRHTPSLFSPHLSLSSLARSTCSSSSSLPFAPVTEGNIREFLYKNNQPRAAAWNDASSNAPPKHQPQKDLFDPKGKQVTYLFLGHLLFQIACPMFPILGPFSQKDSATAIRSVVVQLNMVFKHSLPCIPVCLFVGWLVGWFWLFVGFVGFVGFVCLFVCLFVSLLMCFFY